MAATGTRGKGIGLVLGWVLALAFAALFAVLGYWQLNRMQHKQAMLDAAAQALDRASVQPLLLASDPARARDYDWAAGVGSVGGSTVWLDNQMRDGKPGLRMYCVLLPDDGVQGVLVDAGWWPLDGERTLPTFGCPTQTAQAVRGLLAPPPSSGLAHGDALAGVGPPPRPRPDAPGQYHHWAQARRDSRRHQQRSRTRRRVEGQVQVSAIVQGKG